MRKFIFFLIIYIILCNNIYTTPWQPEKTIALIVGILEWQDKGLATYSKENREDKKLYNILLERGVPDENIMFISDKDGTLLNILSTLKKLSKRGNEYSLFFFYYAGHGIKLRNTGNTYFLNYDGDTSNPDNTCLSLNTIGKIIKDNFKGNRAILTADCCYSGNLNKIADTLDKSGIGTLVLSSSTASNYSTGEWTFTRSLNHILHTSSILNRASGPMDLKSAFKYIYINMKHSDLQMANFYRTNGFPSKFKFTNIEIESDIDKVSHIGEYKEAKWENKWYKVKIIGQKDNLCKIHYIGYEDSWNEWILCSKLKDIEYKTYPAGSKIEVEWDNSWYPAEIIEVKDIFHYIHYSGYGNEWDEWVAYNRIRYK